MKTLKRLCKQFLGTAALFSALVGLGTSAVLLFVSCIGYLPYSDGGISQTGGGNSQQSVNVLLIALEPITQQYKLDIPEAGHVVYVLKNHVWTAHPSFQNKDKRLVVIKPGIDPLYDGGEFKLTAATKFSQFTWYPTIPLGK